MENEDKKYNLIFGALLIAFLLFNLFTLKDYGITWDEPAQHSIGKATTDYLQNANDKIEFARDDLIYYGPFFEILNQYFGKLMMSLGFEYADAFHILILFASAIGLFFSYKLLSLIASQKVALIAIAILITSPRFAAHSHYNPKDIPLMACFFASLYLLYLCFSLKKNSLAVWAGISLGISLATRADAVLILPVFFIPYAIQTIARKEWHIKDFKLFGIIIGAAMLTVFTVWPSLWQKPLVFFESFVFFLKNHGWNNEVLYFGQNFASRDLPWHYPFFYIFGTMPLIVFFAFAIGLPIAIKRSKAKILEYGLLILLPTLRLLTALMPGATRYDGIRHYLFIFPALAAISALGFEFVLSKVKNAKISSAIAAMIIVWIMLEFTKIYPYGDSYFNEIVRAVYPKNIERKLEMEYWGAPYRQGIGWLNKNALENSAVCVPVADHLVFYYPTRKDLRFGCIEKPDYLMYITRQTFIPPNLNDLYKYADLEPVFKISRYNSDLLYIYKLPTK